VTEHTSKPLSTKKPQFIKPLFIGTRAFIRATKTGIPFATYATPTFGEMTISISIPVQYKESLEENPKWNDVIIC
jgi:hypothetical protein